MVAIRKIVSYVIVMAPVGLVRKEVSALLGMREEGMWDEGQECGMRGRNVDHLNCLSVGDGTLYKELSPAAIFLSFFLSSFLPHATTCFS